ncbi:MAG: helix-turn-helix transcriptional regulator [Clostridia bacterium]|nr:helix-turn-helix transcriptional regulator [Clostridia bacterium]
MKLSIGNNIKSLRKAKNITQEQLAELVNVSCQSVSRWESNACYPDMELLPTLAEFFDVTIDQLLGVEKIKEQNMVENYANRFQTALSHGKIEDCIAAAREGVAEFPNNYTLLNQLMYALFISGDETGNIENAEENARQYDDEITRLGERIMKYCPDQAIRLEATARLAFHHCEQGRKSMGRKIYEQLPPMTLCRENQMWWSLEENEKLPFLQKQIKECSDILYNYIWLLANSGKLSHTDSLFILNKAENLRNLITEQKFIAYCDVRLHYDKARLYGQMGYMVQTCEELAVVDKLAEAFDNRPDSQTIHSLLLGEIPIRRTDFETADTRSIKAIFREDWLMDPAFDKIRNTKKFNTLEHFLK